MQYRTSSSDPTARLIAFFLPQFHPIPENDIWWGKGFTEWTNVAAARQLFPGHYQPHIPGDLGFYDLRLAETRATQAAMAARYGIHGFCYWHYWFQGKQLLETPFAAVLASGKPDFPFCLAWANEPWSRNWDGLPRHILQPQSYSDEDDREHIRALLPALTDMRAIKVAGKPVFIVYRPANLPDPARTLETWRKEARLAGLEDLYLIAVENGISFPTTPIDLGFDAGLLFQPNFRAARTTKRRNPLSRLRYMWPSVLGRWLNIPLIYDYPNWWPAMLDTAKVQYQQYHTVCPRWDNTPRRGRGGFLLARSSPEEYERWLRQAIARVQDKPPEHRLVFLNAWNEWAEGAHLEPDRRFGVAYLEATLRGSR